MARWIALPLLPAPLLKADWVVVQKVEESGQKQAPAEMTLKIKGDKIRTDVSPEISIIMDTASGDTTTLRHPQKLYLQVSAEASAQLLKQVGRLREEKERQGTAEEPPKLVATGKRETVAGKETKFSRRRRGPSK